MYSFDLYLKERLTEIDIVIHQLLQRELFSLDSQFVVFTSQCDSILHSFLKECNSDLNLEMSIGVNALKYLPDTNCEFSLDMSWDETMHFFVQAVEELEDMMTLESEATIQLGYYRLLYELDDSSLNEWNDMPLHEVDFIVTSE